MTVIKFAIMFFFSAFLAAKSFGISADKEAEIRERIKPAGSICIEGDASCAGAAVAEVSAEPRSGDTIYNASCTACHATGAAGAPKLGDAGAWAPRIAKGKDTLYTNAINGYNGMPAKGLCMDCSDDEIKVTVDYIISNSK